MKQYHKRTKSATAELKSVLETARRRWGRLPSAAMEDKLMNLPESSWEGRMKMGQIGMEDRKYKTSS